jgi:potassium-transporting ATPase KdpC subunit
MSTFWRELKIAAGLTLVFVLLLCAAYPALVWGAGRLLFPARASGSLVFRAGTVIGSSLIGQPFSAPRYLHPRPSAAGRGYDGAASGGSNAGPLSRVLRDQIAARIARYRQENGLAADAGVPADAVTSSGSGLDPHVSLANALLQSGRIARSRGVSLEAVEALLHALCEGPQLGLLGEKRVNVLTVNLELDRHFPK